MTPDTFLQKIQTLCFIKQQRSTFKKIVEIGHAKEETWVPYLTEMLKKRRIIITGSPINNY